jgi:hypothetical protein
VVVFSVDHVAMNTQQVLYEAKLSREGLKLSIADSAVLVVWFGAGAVLCFVFTSFPDRLLPMAIFLLGAVGFALKTARVLKLRRNPGVYRISIDDFGLYVHSDDPASAPSFSVIAPDMYRLVRKTIRCYESCDDHEYYVETKSGNRHRIEQLFADYDLDAMAMFHRIVDRFPWVRLHEEVQN